MEMKVKEGPTYCALPNYRNEGPWQDWPNMSFTQDEQGVFQTVPSRILFFYIHHFLDDNGDQSNEIRVLVQTCDYQVVAIVLGGYVWKRHTCAAAGSYP
jgi:hypothetical protein